jgi:hypothetical protein
MTNLHFYAKCKESCKVQKCDKLRSFVTCKVKKCNHTLQFASKFGKMCVYVDIDHYHKHICKSFCTTTSNIMRPTEAGIHRLGDSQDIHICNCDACLRKNGGEPKHWIYWQLDRYQHVLPHKYIYHSPYRPPLALLEWQICLMVSRSSIEVSDSEWNQLMRSSPLSESQLVLLWLG